MGKRTWTDKQLKDSLPESRSYQDLSERLGLASPNLVLKRRIQELGLDISHFTGHQRQTEEELEENWQSHIARVSRRQKEKPKVHAEYGRRTYWRLKLEAIDCLGGKCVECGNDNPLVLSINHVDGRDHDDKDTSKDLYRRVICGEEGFDLRCLNCQLLYDYEIGIRNLPNEGFGFLKEHLSGGGE